MKAIVHTGYGAPRDVLEPREVPTPTIGDDEVLVRVQASSVHADVWHVVTGRPRVLRLMGAGLFTPTRVVPGTDLAGVVEQVGRAVTSLQVGDAVFGECVRGMQWVNGGAWAELAVAPADALARKPEHVSFAVAASVSSPGYVALNSLRGQAAVRPGQRVLINGAAGAVGSVALQVAKARGGIVTAVDRADTLELLRTLGADRVIDYAVTDVTHDDGRDPAGYDLIFDVASTLSFSACKRVLSDDGVYLALGHDHYGAGGRGTFGSMPQVFSLLARSLFDRHAPRPDFSLVDKTAAMAELARLLASGALTQTIARAFPLAEAAPALELLTTNTVGRIVLVP
jgi:NADPH:quinone reductase-like Zn-dependent oxidoreductase